MDENELDQVWTVAYAIAFAITTMGCEIMGNRNSPEDIDQRARKLADRATETIEERVKKNKSRAKK